MTIRAGISGWTYEGWRKNFYPEGLAHKKELAFASHYLPSIEINGTFYRLQRPSIYMHWYEETPSHFIFSVKANRYITHVKKLNDVEIPMANFFSSGVLALKEKLGPLLWQFPPSMPFNPDKFKRFLELLPHDFKEARLLARKSELSKEKSYVGSEQNYPLRHAVEIRHESFYDPLFIELMRERGAAIVFADTAGRWPYLEDVTADFVYLRLHGDEELYVSGYDDESLDFWAKRVRSWHEGREPIDRMTLLTERGRKKKSRDVFIYFDNDVKTRAPFDAKSLLQKVRKKT